MRKWTALLLTSGLLAACSQEQAQPSTELGEAADEITYGELDTTHQAVVAYSTGSSWCTATIIHKLGSVGYALTAAHCIPSSAPWGSLRQGDNRASGQFDEQYTVTDAEIHPGYDGGATPLYDFAVLTFSGATDAPVIPAMSESEDNLHDGSQVDLVGYGQTESGSTTLRHHLVRPVTDVTAMRLVFNQTGTAGGLCSGDSGGPVLSGTGTAERVAGVSSFVSGSCSDWGTAVRVSAVYDTFIMPYINNTSYGEQTCSQCYDASTYQGSCYSAVEDCFDDTDCEAYANCRAGCSSTNCTLQCALDNLDGVPLYQGIDQCVCDTGCASECQDEGFCGGGSGCGFTSGLPGCQSCFDEHCCDEAQACADDWPICSSCFTSVAHSSCPTPEYDAFFGCMQSHCALECNTGMPGEGGAGGGAAVGGGGAAAGFGGSSAGGGPPGIGGPPEDNVEEEDDGGCSCSTAPSPTSAWPWLLSLCAAASLGRRRRLR